MKVFTASQTKEIDQRTIIEEPISSIMLMERACLAFVNWFTDKFDASQPIIVFAGFGNNGGDALAISRMLIERKYTVRAFAVPTAVNMSDDCKINFDLLFKLSEIKMLNLKEALYFPKPVNNEIIIDGIFGSGLNRPIEEPITSLIKFINSFSNTVVSIDIPSGIFAEDNRSNNLNNCIRASYTVSFEFPFLSFYFEGNEKLLGIPVIVPIGLISGEDCRYRTIDIELAGQIRIPRKKYSHKGIYGHALIIAGKYGMMGAALLSGKACVRGGAGLTSISVPSLACDTVQIGIPEAIVQIDSAEKEFNTVPQLEPYNSIACGPGIGQSAQTAEALHELILKARVPLVLDADALNIVSEHKEWLKLMPEGSVITPHPKEFDRLAGVSNDSYSRHLKQLEFARQYKLIVVLKGANTIISTPEGYSYINTTGNPGMASGGTGDVLTGLLVSLLAQGYTSINAAVLAVFIHGLAGDIALETSSHESIIAGDLIENFGKAFRLLTLEN